MGNYQKAEICINQAEYLRQKYNINFTFDVEPEHYPVYNQEEETPQIVEDEGEMIEHPREESEES